MAYGDVPFFNYGVLERMRNTRAPYRGNQIAAWPFGDRAYSDRHFRFDPETGIYDLYLGHLKTLDRILSSCDDGLMSERDERMLEQCHIGRMYPDNTFEFLADQSQGNFMMLESAFNKRFKTQSNLGGGLMWWRDDKYQVRMHPLFKGIRLNPHTTEVHPSTHYVTLHPTLKTKESHEYMAQFDEFRSVFNMFLDPLESDGVAEIVEDLKVKYNLTGDIPCAAVAPVIEDLVRQKYYTDAVIMCVAFRSSWTFRNPRASANYIKYAAKYMTENKAAFTYWMLRDNQSMFKYREIPMGEKLPVTKWLNRVQVNGVDMQRL